MHPVRQFLPPTPPGADRSSWPLTAPVRVAHSVIAARLLAEQLGVPLEVVTVLQAEVIYGVALGGMPIDVPEIDEARRANRAAAVNDFLTRYSGDAATPPVHIRFGGIADEIARVARERDATLVVVSAAPHQRLNRFIAGERAVQVLRGSTVPVLSVPPGFSTLPRNIVVAVDFSPASVRAAQAALLLLGKGGTLTLIHILSPLLGDAPLRDATGGDPANAVQTLFGRLRDELRLYVPDEYDDRDSSQNRQGCRGHCGVRDGHRGGPHRRRNARSAAAREDLRRKRGGACRSYGGPDGPGGSAAVSRRSARALASHYRYRDVDSAPRLDRGAGHVQPTGTRDAR